MLKITTNDNLKYLLFWIILKTQKSEKMKMKQKKIQKLAISALLTSIVCVATFVVKIPSPATNGYFNLGDCFVLLSGFVLGPVYGALAAGLGSALADILSGYMQYAPATFVIKTLMAVAAYLLAKSLAKKPLIGKILSGIAAETIMVLGYFGYEAIILGYGIAAAGSIFSNVMQGIVGIIAGIAVTTAIEKNKTINSFLKR